MPAAIAAPLVTVLIGAYNSASTLERAIDAILVQTVSDLELIVVDDGSRDRTSQIVAAAIARDPVAASASVEAILRVRTAGPQLRESRAAWFERNARRLSLERSLDRVAAAYGDEGSSAAR